MFGTFEERMPKIVTTKSNNSLLDLLGQYGCYELRFSQFYLYRFPLQIFIDSIDLLEYYNNIFQWKVYLLAPYISQIIFKYKRWKYILFTESFAVKFLEKDCINGTVCRHESVLFELYYNFMQKCLKAYGGKSIWTRMEELDEAREDGRNGLRGTSFAWSQ